MTDVLHFGAEVFVAKSCQLLDQPFRLFTGKGTGKEDAVNQHPQFRILKLARHKVDAALHGNLIPHFSQEHKIILNRLPRTWNAIVFSSKSTISICVKGWSLSVYCSKISKISIFRAFLSCSP